MDGCSISFESTLDPLTLCEIKQILRQVTTRQPLPWYEMDGAFPCLVRNGKYLYPVLAIGIDKESRTLKIQSCHDILVDYCEPLNIEQAAKYGVE